MRDLMNIHDLRKLNLSEKALMLYCDSDYHFAKSDGKICVYNGKPSESTFIRSFERADQIQDFLCPPFNTRW